MNSYKKVLLEKGIKPTFQRMKILEYLDGNTGHPNVDTIYTALFKQVPTLSKTTVYNVLNTFKANGLVQVISITGAEARYDPNVEPHHHFFCRKCGTITDFKIQYPHVFQAPQLEGYKIEEIQGYFKGVCKRCLEDNVSNYPE
ncbi:MAG: Fur family transcriptional regulator [Methanosarcinaceae archaeon]